MKTLLTAVVLCLAGSEYWQSVRGDDAEQTEEAKKYRRILATEKTMRTELELERAKVEAALNQNRKTLKAIEDRIRSISISQNEKRLLIVQLAQGNKVVIKGQQQLADLNLKLINPDLVYRIIRSQIGSIGYLGNATVVTVVDNNSMIVRLESLAVLMVKGHPTGGLNENVRIKIATPFEVTSSTKHNGVVRLVAEPIDTKLLVKYRSLDESM
jgi:hypothetical protein